VQAPEPAPATVVHVTTTGTLLAFTDGAMERRGESLDAGLDRLRAAATDASGRPLEGMLDDLLVALASEANKDDTVLLGMRWG
jgi:hypothetical protein